MPIDQVSLPRALHIDQVSLIRLDLSLFVPNIGLQLGVFNAKLLCDLVFAVQRLFRRLVELLACVVPELLGHSLRLLAQNVQFSLVQLLCLCRLFRGVVVLFPEKSLVVLRQLALQRVQLVGEESLKLTLQRLLPPAPRVVEFRLGRVEYLQLARSKFPFQCFLRLLNCARRLLLGPVRRLLDRHIALGPFLKQLRFQ